MRVKLTTKDRDKLFISIYNRDLSWKFIATSCDISIRTLHDWRAGKITIPELAYKKLLKIAGFSKNNLSPKFIPEFWHIKEAASKGGFARQMMYGDLGTPEGRRRGGLASVVVNKNNITNFVKRKIITYPRNSEQLAELMGILVGDGHLSEYQVSITTNSKTDIEHALWLKKVTESLFGIVVQVMYRKDELTVTLRASSKNLVTFLSKKGMPVGNKINNGLRVPNWILKSPQYHKAFLRGLFDTDGCVYLDIHKNSKSKKIYKHIGIAITSYADGLRSDIIILLKGLGFNPTNSGKQMSVYLRKQIEVVRYFQEIGSHNPKHLQRYAQFCGEVPKWS